MGGNKTSITHESTPLNLIAVWDINHGSWGWLRIRVKSCYKALSENLQSMTLKIYKDFNGLLFRNLRPITPTLLDRKVAYSMSDKIRTALYLRVSTPGQKPDLQYDALRNYAARCGLTIVGDYRDIAVSGHREGRTQLNKRMIAARNRDHDLYSGMEIRSFCTVNPASTDDAGRIPASRRSFHKRPGPDRYQQSDGTRHVYHYRCHGRTGVSLD